jgi:hypothetical protein
MPIRTAWLVRGQVILSQLVGDISEDDILDSIEDLETLIATHDESDVVHIIQDARRIGKPFSELDKVANLMGVLRRFNGWHLVLNNPGNRLFEFVTQFSTQTINLRTRPAYYNYAELRTFLVEHYPDLEMPETLPDLFGRPDAAEAG